ncbi:hypothetical protein ACIQU1_07700 [Streptomyces angustmyceticus]|uniref:hypothetical protein n=1 Tax=Streptomyces angustmyceticus TaxID=285578 RepID=UPI0037F893C1
MNAAQQHLLDSYRAAQRGEPAPPAPGVHTVRTAREIKQWRRFLAVVTDPEDRVAGRVRRGVGAGVAALLRLPRGPLPPPHPAPPQAPAPASAQPTPTSAQAPAPAPVPTHPDGTPRPDGTPHPAPRLPSDATP